MTQNSQCPFAHHLGDNAVAGTRENSAWWPKQLNLKILHGQSVNSNPMGEDFCYADEFKKLNLDEIVKDLRFLMTDSQEWWPADYGHYGPFFIRMAWHSAGTYRTSDGRGGARSGAQRFAPLNSWPDNGNLDKARRLLWPIKQKYGRKISWADLMILAGNVALESMGFKTIGFGGGREDIFEPEEETFWGPEKTWLGDERYSGNRELLQPFGAVQMGLIYVNPEGPNGKPDPVASAKDIRETFARMAMNDEETVALVAGGHTFGKCHGAAPASQYVGPEPEGAEIEEQGFGWKNSFGSGKGKDTITSGIEGAWTTNPIQWDNNYFENLFGYDWELTKSPAGAHQWVPKQASAKGTVPDAHDRNLKHAPIMTTADLALRFDPAYEKISKRFLDKPQDFADAFAKAWFKLTHRDMGPISCYLGKLVPKTQFIWQDPLPQVQNVQISHGEAEALKKEILSLGFTAADLVLTAWASASTFRKSDRRGGTNGARIRFAPLSSWEVNSKSNIGKILSALEKLQTKLTGGSNVSMGSKVSLADLIVLAGNAAIEDACKSGNVSGRAITVPFKPGRVDALESETDLKSFDVLEPVADGFRNYVRKGFETTSPQLLIDKASLLGLSAPETVVLLGGMRALGANFDGSNHGLFQKTKGTLNNSYFVHLLDINVRWQKKENATGEFVGFDQKTGQQKYTATSVDLVMGSNSQLRALCEVYASADASEKFLNDFVKAWSKVMSLGC